MKAPLPPHHGPHDGPDEFTPWPEALARTYREAGYWQGEPFGAWLSGLARRYADRPALLTPDGPVTYRELDRRATVQAAALAERGLRPGDRVTLHLPNTPAFFELLLGLLRLGVRPILALPAHREHELGYFCAHAGAAALVTAADPERLALAARVQAGLDRPLPVIALGENPGTWEGEAVSFLPSAATAPTPDFTPPRVDAGGVALYQLSGGSTGTPKLIGRTHDDYLYSIRASADLCELGADTVYLAALPLAHNFPLTSPGTLGALHAGGRVMVAPDAAPGTAFPLIAAHGVTHTALVPALLQVWLRALEGSPHTPFPSLRCVQVGGAPLSPDVARQVRPRLGAALQQVFGMAEGLVNYVRPGAPDEEALGTQGRPISPHDEVRIVDDHDRPVPDGTSGHLLTRGPYTIRGYFRAPDHNARAFTPDGFYRTGDLVTRTPGGALVITGRHKDQINRAGEKIAAEEIEHALLRCPLVQAAAVVGTPDPWLGERSVAFVQVTPTQLAPDLALTLRRHLRDLGLAAFKIPDRIEPLPALPRTPLGKTDKPALRALAAQSVAQPAAPSTPPTHRSRP